MGIVLHDMCQMDADAAINNPIKGKATIRKSLPGTWTRTIITAKNTDNCGSDSTKTYGCTLPPAPRTGGPANCYGAGGSGDCVVVKKGVIKENPRSGAPVQDILVIVGGFN